MTGEVETLTLAAARKQAGLTPVLVCHAPLTLQRIGLEALATLDLLELFAFVHPAVFCVPTPQGAGRRAGPACSRHDTEGAALLLWQARTRLLDELAEIDDRETTSASPPLPRKWDAVAGAGLGRF
jgi:ATP-dependent DNA helicase DinG